MILNRRTERNMLYICSRVHVSVIDSLLELIWIKYDMKEDVSETLVLLKGNIYPREGGLCQKCKNLWKKKHVQLTKCKFRPSLKIRSLSLTMSENRHFSCNTYFAFDFIDFAIVQFLLVVFWLIQKTRMTLRRQTCSLDTFDRHQIIIHIIYKHEETILVPREKSYYMKCIQFVSIYILCRWNEANSNLGQ